MNKTCRIISAFLLTCLVLGNISSVSATGPVSQTSDVYQEIVDEVNAAYGANYVITDMDSEITISPALFREKLVNLAVALNQEQQSLPENIEKATMTTGSNVLATTSTKTMLRYFSNYFQLIATARYYYEGSGSSRSYFYSTNTAGNTVAITPCTGCYEYSFTLDTWEKYVRSNQKFYDVTIHGEAWVSSGGIVVKYEDVNSTFVFTEDDLR